ncbi:SAM-dependent methyltransferase [Streptomyces sp. NBC_00887]|uniref:SAM-dependent methyltransferase n=1 Tax=Streptomyces sp. NBC_00887 TaxID=2975859 RepID=UPI003868E158|nr:SAM-dependent methyltransferase [Streptomyces sp. NBC_00887]WSY36365.1 SAM-dependent methyltransferase [Streptomyces sp. NBC_00887]
MVQGREFLPETIDLNRASVPRMYDYFLGGKDHYPADREACHRLLDQAPQSRLLARAQRHFRLRAVRTLALAHGIDQFVEFGCGLPRWENTHTTARRARPESKVVYVDRDPMVVAHGRALMEEAGTAVVQGDLSQAPGILSHPDIANLVDLTRPVAVLAVSYLHTLPDRTGDQPAIARLIDALPTGSFLVASQLISRETELANRIDAVMHDATGGQWGHVRSVPEATILFNGLELLDPGVTDVSLWRPDDMQGRPVPGPLQELGGIGQKSR